MKIGKYEPLSLLFVPRISDRMEINMKHVKVFSTIIFIFYLILIFLIFFNSDKNQMTVYSSIGSAIYIIIIKRYSDEN